MLSAEPSKKPRRKSRVSADALLALRMEQDNVQRQPDRAPLTPPEQARYQELKGHLQGAWRREHARALAAYEEGQALLEIRARGLWMPDPTHDHPDFLSWAGAALGAKDRTTAWRRLRLAQAFPSRAAFEALVLEDKLQLSVLLAIAGVPEPWRADLLDVARQQALTVRQVYALLDAAELRFHEVQQAHQQDPHEAAGDAWHQTLLEIAQQLIADREQSRLLRQTQTPAPAPRLCPRCEQRKNGPRAQAPHPDPAALEARAAAQDKREQDLDALEQQLRGRTVALDRREAQLAQREAQRACEAALTQEAPQEAQLAAAQKELDQLRAQIGALRAEGAQHLAQQEQVAQRQAELALELTEREHKLQSDALRLIEIRDRLARQGEHMEEAQVQFQEWIRQIKRGTYRWGTVAPESLDAVLLDMADAYERLSWLAYYARRYLGQHQLPLRAGFAAIGEVMLWQSKPLTNDVKDLVLEIHDRYEEAHPARFATERDAFFARKKAELRPGGAAPTPALPGPARFALPTAAMLGEAALDPGQWGIFAVTPDQKQALAHSLNRPGLITILGMQGYGKTHTCLVFVEMMLRARENISKNVKPMAVLAPHWGQGFSAYPPDLRTSRLPNDEPRSQFLLRLLQAKAQGIGTIKVWVPPLCTEELRERRAEYLQHGVPEEDVQPFAFTLWELGEDCIFYLMKADRNSAGYLSQFSLALHRVWKEARGKPTLARLRAELAREPMAENIRHNLDVRLDSLARYIHDGPALSETIQPVLYLADLRSSLMAEHDVGVVLPMMLRMFTHGLKAKGEVRGVFLDEAGKLFTSYKGFEVELLRMLNEVRHRGALVLANAQSPEQLPQRFIEEAQTVITHRLVGEDAYKALLASKAGYKSLRREQLASLPTGDVIVYTEEASDPEWQQQPQQATVRPALCLPGGTTIQVAPSEGVLERAPPKEDPERPA